MSEQYKGYDPQPEGAPMLSLSSEEIDKLVEEVETRRNLARTQTRKQSEDPEVSLQTVLREHHALRDDIATEVSNRLLAHKLQQKVTKPRVVGNHRTITKEIHPRGWLGELEDRQG